MYILANKKYTVPCKVSVESSLSQVIRATVDKAKQRLHPGASKSVLIGGDMLQSSLSSPNNNLEYFKNGLVEG